MDRLAENVLEVYADITRKTKKSVENAALDNILKAEILLRNTGGGIIKVNDINNVNVTHKSKDEWVSNLLENGKIREVELQKLGDEHSSSEVLDFYFEGSSIYIFVKKTTTTFTSGNYPCKRKDIGVDNIKHYLQICNIIKRKDQKCCCSYGSPIVFNLGQKMTFPESVNVEYKKFGEGKENLPSSVSKELWKYKAQFANTNGGTVYFGIDDNGKILGVKIEDIAVKEDIVRSITECMESNNWYKQFRGNIGPEEDKLFCGNIGPEEVKKYYSVQFYPVVGADEKTQIIAVHICQFPGIVLNKLPICEVLDLDNNIVSMKLDKWLAVHHFKSMNSSVLNNSRFEQWQCQNKSFLSVKDNMKKIKERMQSVETGQLSLHPSHACKWIGHQALTNLINLTNELFMQKGWQGCAYIEKCWQVNLGQQATKPPDVLCDILFCGPQIPLVLITITQGDAISDETRRYNKQLAMMVNRELQEASCLEKLYVKPHILPACSDPQVREMSAIFSHDRIYPSSYSMNDLKYNTLLEALVWVLARANSMATHEVIQTAFHLLTAEQYDILHGYYESAAKIQITGPPGTGKTLIALERIIRLRLSDWKEDEILFVCSNKVLQANIESKRMKHNGQPYCLVKNYSQIIECVRSRQTFEKRLGNVKHVLADELHHYRGKVKGISFDWWKKFMSLCGKKEHSTFWVFFDLSQKVFNGPTVDAQCQGFVSKKLKAIIRTTGSIHQFISGRYTPVDPEIHLGHEFQGDEVELVLPGACPSYCSVHDSIRMVKVLFAVLRNLISVQGHDINKITVLFHTEEQRNKNTDIFTKMKNNRYQLRMGDDVSGRGVIFETTRRYAGDHNDIIIGFCPTYYGKKSSYQNHDALMTCICSRAFQKLILIFKNQHSADVFKISNCNTSRIPCSCSIRSNHDY